MASFSRPRATFRMATSCEPLEAVGCAAMLCWAMVSQPARMAIAEADRVSLPVAPRKLRRVAANRVSIMLDMSVLRIWVEQTNLQPQIRAQDPDRIQAGGIMAAWSAPCGIAASSVR